MKTDGVQRVFCVGVSLSAVQFNAGLEKNKLFVRHVPYLATNSELEELFAVVRLLRLAVFFPLRFNTMCFPVSLGCLISHTWKYPRKGPPRFLTEDHMSMAKSGLAWP